MTTIYEGGYSDEQRELDEAEYGRLEKLAQAKAKAKADVIAKLGLTADEVAALLS
jgi:hypothetical protein